MAKKNYNEKDHSHLPKRWLSCDVEADYFGDERKLDKRERKLASAKDRSQYKKTDLRKQPKQKEFDTSKEGLERGRVLSIASQGILVDHNGSSFICFLRGSLKKDKTQAKNLVTVGDFVIFEITSPNEGYIVHVEPRSSSLSRADNLSRRKEQLIAANIDQVLITTSVVLPELKPSLIDRYIIASQKGGMSPIVVVNKIDLFNDSAFNKDLIEKEKELLQELLTAYPKLGIPVIPVSTMTGEGIDLLKQAMKDKASVFSGQSGVGKSSLINAITSTNLLTGDIVDKTKKGSHTTTTAQLLRLDFGGWCIDTPGIKSFGVWDLDKNEIEEYFPEIFSCGHACKYPDCSHLGEEGCAVIQAIENNEISPLRYQSYASLLLNTQEPHTRR